MNLVHLGERLYGVARERHGENRQLTFGSRWGAAPFTGAAQMPPIQSERQSSWDAGARRCLLVQPQPRPLHLLSHSLRVITRSLVGT